MKARRIKVKLTYDNKDISSDIAPFLKSFSFNDTASNEADDISIVVEDRKELWEADWFPEKGATLKASFIIINWNGKEEECEIPIGTFEIDEITISGLPHEVAIKGVSIPNNNTLRGIQRNRAWEKIRLSVVAKEIADNAGMKLYLNLHNDDEIERLEQKEESDLAFLVRVAKERSYGLRLSDEQIDIYYVPDLDVAEPMFTIKKDSTTLSSYSLSTKTRDTYKAAHVRYENTKKGILIEYTFTDPDKKEGKTLEIHKKVDSVAMAEELAKAELREKNKDEVKGTLNFAGMYNLGDTSARNLWFSGFTIALEGFHELDGKYLVTKTSHSISGSGYTCRVDIRRCLNGY